MTTAALIVAAGRGSRAGGGLPKQYRQIGGEPILARTIRALLTCKQVDLLRVVIHPDDKLLYEDTAPDDPRLGPPIIGGSERALSVKLGLEAMAEDPPNKILVHDAARPFVTQAAICDVIEALVDYPGALAAVPVVDALRREEDGLCADPIDRTRAWRAQTPQGFHFDEILAAHRANTDPMAADDAELARAAGLSVKLVESNAENFKITTPNDFARAERQLSVALETRVGQGYDVHAFASGEKVTLCGVDIPFDKTLSGHSDADVSMHALTDAIFGALAEGDIGQWFPPSEAEWKGADSAIFLEKAMERIRARGGVLINADITIVCEQPKIGPHAQAMRQRLAEIMMVEVGRISVKATTSERLGFTGRSEGIAANAIVSISL